MGQEKNIVLIQEILGGNHDSENIFYDKYKKIVEDYLRSKYYYSDFDDDVAEIMIKVFTNLKNYNSDKSKIKSWVITIAKNYMIDKWRASGITFTTSNTGYNNEFDGIGITTGSSYSGGSLTVDGTSGISYATTTADTQSHYFYNTGASYDYMTFNYTGNNSGCFEVNDAINYLTTELTTCECTLLNMKYVQGFTYDEIASEFNLTSSTVSNKVNYIKSKIKKEHPELVKEK